MSGDTTLPAVKYGRVTDLLVRYWGMGRRLDTDEKDVLLRALDAENKLLRGPIHLRALERLKEKGIE
jgi:hypothetical protein